MPAAYAVAVIVLAVIGFLVWFARSQQRSALLAMREAELSQIAKIHEEGNKVDEQTAKKLGEVGNPAVDPRAMWLRDQKRVSDLSSPSTSGNQVQG